MWNTKTVVCTKYIELLYDKSFTSGGNYKTKKLNEHISNILKTVVA